MKKELLIVTLLRRLLIGLVKVLEGKRIKLSIFLKMAISLFFCVILHSATAQAQTCIQFSNTSEDVCKLYSLQISGGCYWCPTKSECNPHTNCLTCAELGQGECNASNPVCRWTVVGCVPKSCGNGDFDPGPAGEECDGTSNCTATCTCAEGFIPDSGLCKAANNPPVLDPIGNKAVDEGQTLQFKIFATDPDGDTLTYDAGNLPTGASFDKDTQTFAWTPTYEQGGNYYYDATFTVSDGLLSDWETITISVGNLNRPPVLGAIDNRTIDENKTLTFDISATDPDGDALTYSASAASDLPKGADFLNQTFSWTPEYTQAGNYDVTFSVFDGSASDWEKITITVGNVNRPPVLTPIGSKTVNEGQPLEITITGSDPDGDALTYSTSDLPSGATFANRTFSWKPSYCQAGSYPGVHFEVSDGFLTAFEDITITVNDFQDGVIQATIDINPDTLDLKSKSDKNAVTAYIELSVGCDVNEINVSSVILNVNRKTIFAQSAPISIGDYDGDGLPDLMVKFDRQAVISALGGITGGITGQITMTVSGKLNNGPEFTGSDTIKVINPGK